MPRLLLSLARTCCLFAILVSTLLFVHYLAPGESGLCGGTSGCEALRRSGFGYFFDLPYMNMPLVGMLVHAGLLALILGKSWGKRIALGRVAFGVTGILAVTLILAQALYFGTFCWLCMLVDISSTGAALCVLLIPVRAESMESQWPGLYTWSWVTLTGLAVALPLVWIKVKPSVETPAAIAALAPADAVSLIEFADFECPYCRQLHPVLKRVAARHADAVHVLRLHMPLPRHPHSRAAAQAAVCAEQAGRGTEMADLLFEGDLSDTEIASHAQALGLDASTFNACLTSPATEARIERDIALLKDADFQGLPTTYVGRERIIGLASEEVYEEAIQLAKSGNSARRVPGWLFVVGSLIVLLVITRLGLIQRAQT